MVVIEEIDRILAEARAHEGILNLILVSRTGKYIAGETPEGSHPDTFVAMFAILLGAAETATSELKENLGYIGICLETSKVMVVSNGPKALYVVIANRDADEDEIIKLLKDKNEEIQEFL